MDRLRNSIASPHIPIHLPHYPIGRKEAMARITINRLYQNRLAERFGRLSKEERERRWEAHCAISGDIDFSTFCAVQSRVRDVDGDVPDDVVQKFQAGMEVIEDLW